MKKLLKTNLFLLIITVSFFITSCFDNSIPGRTFEQEMAELNEQITLLNEDGYDVDTTESGVYYITHQEGEGPLVSEGDTVKINYIGYLNNGYIFDATASWSPDSTWEFIYLEQPLIQGFNDGLAVMNKGSEVEMIIPSNLAYGEYGTGTIGSFQTLIFSVKMIDIKPPL
ncbi:MAG: FKBP-type peptidyl-prolyl cis-trans isomerase [Bacteroidota bacterium]